MTARYGRNQKRRAREALAAMTADLARADQALAATVALAQETARRFAWIEAQLDQICEQIIDAFGEDSALLPVERMSIISADYDIYRWRVKPKPENDPASWRHPRAVQEAMFATATVSTVDMVKAVIRMEEDHERFAVLIRLGVVDMRDRSIARRLGPDGKPRRQEAVIQLSRDVLRRRTLTDREIDQMFDMHRDQLKAFTRDRW